MITTKNRSSDEVLTEILLDVKRVTKVVEGGRKFSFAACVVVGNNAGSVGYAHRKANEISDARTKAVQAAKKNMIKVPLYQGRTIHHDVLGKSGAAKVILRRAKSGTGIIAGGAARSVFVSLGIHDIVVKSNGSTNVYSMIEAVFDALKKLHSPRMVAERRGKKPSELPRTSGILG